jgi:hypothetical protein
LLASPTPVIPDVEETLRMLFEMPVRSTICLPSEINAALAQYYPRDAVQLVRKKDGTTAAVSSAPKAKASAASADPVNDEPLSDEEKKNRLMSTVMAFNFSVMAITLGLFFLKIPRGLVNHWAQFPVLGLAGVLVVGIAAFLVWNKLSR